MEGLLLLLFYLALIGFWVSVLLGLASLPFVLAWSLVLAIRRRHRERPRDRGAEPVAALEVRTSTRERDHAAADLVRHWHEGRLTVEELDRRIGRALAARTRGELELLRADLP